MYVKPYQVITFHQRPAIVRSTYQSQDRYTAEIIYDTGAVVEVNAHEIETVETIPAKRISRHKAPRWVQLTTLDGPRRRAVQSYAEFTIPFWGRCFVYKDPNKRGQRSNPGWSEKNYIATCEVSGYVLGKGFYAEEAAGAAWINIVQANRQELEAKRAALVKVLSLEIWEPPAEE